MEYVTFYIGERPQVYWDWDLAGKNLEFLRGIDASYFEHVVVANEPFLEGDSKLHAAAALRMAYSQALESFFGLACAAMQAPGCVVGWMLSYKNSDLSAMVAGVSSLTSRPLVRPEHHPASWESLARTVHAGVDCDDQLRALTQEGFGKAWSRFARDFADERRVQEYNSLKHGTRPSLGGFYLNFGVEDTPGVPASPEAMHCMGGSEFGSTFFVPERLGGKALHCRPRSVSVNWVPGNLVEGLRLLALSINNLVAYLRFINHDDCEGCQFAVLDVASAYDLPWAKSCGVTSSSMDSNIRVDDVALWTRPEVLQMLKEPSSASG